MKSLLFSLTLIPALVSCSSHDYGGTTPSSRPGRSVTADWPKERYTYGTVQKPVVASYSTQGRIIREEPYSEAYSSSGSGDYGSGYYSGGTSYAGTGSRYRSGSSDYDLYTGGSVQVSGYTRSDGTYVRSHTRTAPDSSRSNNHSYRGRYYSGNETGSNQAA